MYSGSKAFDQRIVLSQTCSSSTPKSSSSSPTSKGSSCLLSLMGGVRVSDLTKEKNNKDRVLKVQSNWKKILFTSHFLKRLFGLPLVAVLASLPRFYL